MVKLSVVIITFNEEKNIGRCLDSVKEIADEVVVLDSFSTDGTEVICHKKGVRFFQHAFDGHIEQKNRAITHASFPHVLSLDADEALSDTLKESILGIKQHWEYDGYYMNRLTNYCGKWIYHCGWYPDRKLRMWDSRKGRWGGINPHDKFELTAPGATTGFLKGDLLHYSYYTLDDHYKQVHYFTDIAAQAFYAKGERADILKVYLRPVAKFIKDFFLKLGFLDGIAGFHISRISAYAAFLKYHKLRTLYQTHAREKS